MEIQPLDFDVGPSLDIPNFSDPSSIEDSFTQAIAVSSSGCGWRRLKRESMAIQPNIDPLWFGETGAKLTDLDEELDEAIYEQTKSALAKLGVPSLKDRSISNEELDALTPLIKKILYLVTPTEEESKVKQKEKIGLLEQIANHSFAQDEAAKKLAKKEIEELKASADILVSAKGKHEKGFGHKVAMFWKKHKKAIIITAAVVAVAAAVVVVVAATSAGVAVSAGGAAGGGALLAGSDHAEKNQSKSNPCPILSQPMQSEQPLLSYPFTTFDPYLFPGKIRFSDTGVYCDDKFSSYEDTLRTPPSIGNNSWLNKWLHSAETAFPTPGSKPLQPTITDVTLPIGPDFNAFAFQARGDWALASGYHDQALQDFNTAIGIEPNNPSTYLGRGIANFELGQYDACINDYNQYASLVPKEFSLSDFSVGFTKGLPKGVYDSGEGMLLFLSDLVMHPIQTSSQVYGSLSTLSGLVKTGEWEGVGAALSPEVHELVTQWEILSDSKKGELAGYAFGKLGADICLPGGAAKIVARGASTAKELGAVCKNLQAAEKMFVLEAVAAGGNAGKDVGAVIASAERLLTAGENLGLSAKQMAELKQAGNLEQVVGKGRDYFAGNPAMQASYDFINSAEKALEPHITKIMPETEVRRLIEQTGMKTFPTLPGIPEDYAIKITKRGAGMDFCHPTNPQLRVRVMPGKPHSSNPHQQKPYVIQMKNGKAFDKFGNMVSRNAPEAHIPYDEFIYRE